MDRRFALPRLRLRLAAATKDGIQSENDEKQEKGLPHPSSGAPFFLHLQSFQGDIPGGGHSYLEFHVEECPPPVISS
jgi:hypothetical protein